MIFEQDLSEVMRAAEKAGIPWDNELFEASFGKGTYRWLIEAMGISYSDGMDIGLFDLHLNYDRSDTPYALPAKKADTPAPQISRDGRSA